MKVPAKWWLILALAVGLVVLARLLEFWPAPTQTHENNSLSFDVGKTQSRNNAGSTSTSTSGRDATFSPRRILLVVDSAHPLNQRVSAMVAEGLRGLPRVEEVTVTDPDHLPAAGSVAPDLFARINLRHLDENGLVSHALNANVTASLGTSFSTSDHYMRDATTPPTIDFHWGMDLDHQTIFKGMRSDRYAAPAHSIAEVVFKGMSNQIASYAAKYPLLPALPADFYGPYQPAKDFGFLKEIKARPMGSYSGLFVHNDTFWIFTAGTNPVPELQHLADELVNEGWTLGDVSLTNTMDHSVSLTRDGTRMEIFRERRGFGLSFDETKPEPANFIVHHRQPFSRQECEAALDKLFAGAMPVETLLPFESSFSSAQRKKFFEQLEKAPATTPTAYLHLAGRYWDRKDTNAATRALLHAKILAKTIRDPSDLDSGIDTLAKRISPKKGLKLEMTAEACRDLGFLEITNAFQPIDIERAPGQPLLLFGREARGLKTMSLTIDPPQKNYCPWISIQTTETSRLTSSSSLDLSHPELQETVTFDDVKATVSAVVDHNRIKFTIRPAP